jgi:hypothetical protein
MNPTYVRVAIYTVAALAAAAGFGKFDASAGTLTLDLNQIALAVAAGGAVNAAILAKWGKK